MSTSFKIKTALTALAVTAAVAVSAGPATAETEGHEDLRAFWTQYGVSETVQDSLIDKFETTGGFDASSAAAIPQGPGKVMR